MPDIPMTVLHWVNVVILAKFHNPSILNPDFLERQGIVPPDWKAIKVLNTPAFATIKYDKKIVFILDQERLEIKKECDKFLENYDIHNIAKQYISSLPHVVYTSVGLNWHISIKMDEPQRIVTERFIKPEVLEDSKERLLRSTVMLSFDVGNSECNLNIAPGKARVSDKDFYPAIVINVNINHKGPFSPDQVSAIVAIINRWKEREEFIKELIPKILGKAL